MYHGSLKNGMLRSENIVFNKQTNEFPVSACNCHQIIEQNKTFLAHFTTKYIAVVFFPCLYQLSGEHMEIGLTTFNGIPPK